MKYSLKVDGRVFEVEIEDINTRPVIVHVDGIEFEVMPEKMEAVETHGQTQKKSNAPGPVRSTFSSAGPMLHGNALKAPLPGVVLEVFVKSGEKVEAGRVILIIEAMKMKNSI